MFDGPKAYLDANAFVYALEDHGEVGQRCRDLLAAIRSRSLFGVTSELSIAETLIGPFRRRQNELKRSYLALFTPSRSVVELAPVTSSILRASVAYRVRAHPTMPDPGENRRNFLPDAIHVATAIAERATVYVSSDVRIRLPNGMALSNPRTATFDLVLSKLLA